MTMGKFRKGDGEKREREGGERGRVKRGKYGGKDRR